MSFFDNWRVEASMRREPLDKIDAYENEYNTASESRKNEIFIIYKQAAANRVATEFFVTYEKTKQTERAATLARADQAAQRLAK